MVAGLIAIISPTLADVLTPGPDEAPVTQSQESEQATFIEPSPSPSSETVTAQTAPAETPTATATATGSPSPTPTASDEPIPEVDAPLNSQPVYTIRAQQSIAIDPRADKYFLPPLVIDGPEFTLACIGSPSVSFDIGSKMASDNNPDTSTVAVGGDRSSHVYLAGPTQAVAALLNSGGGLFAYATSFGLKGKYLTLTLVATSAPTLDPEFCSAASGANIRIISFRTIGLQVDTRKGSGTLK
jgi:hypothetical protein